MYTIIFKEDVTKEIANIYDWYERKMVTLGEKFLDSLDNSLTLLQQNPTYYSFIHKSKRKIILKGFPYKIIYEIFEEEILVFGLKHFKQDNLEYEVIF